MRRGNRRRCRRGRRSRGAAGRIGPRALGAGRRAAVWAEGAGRSIVAAAQTAGRRVVERTERNVTSRARSTRRRLPVKRGGGFRRRVSEVASSLHGRGFILWAAALVTGLLCVWQHVHSNELALEIEALKNAREALETEIGLLEMECVALSARKRIEQYATDRLGMRYPQAGEVIWLRPSDSGCPEGGREDYVMGEAPSETKG